MKHLNFILLLFLLLSFSKNSYSQRLSKEERQAIIDNKKSGRNDEKEKIANSTLSLDTETNTVIFRKIVDVDSTLTENQIHSLLKKWIFENRSLLNDQNKERGISADEILFSNNRANTVHKDQEHKITNNEIVNYDDQYKSVTKGVTKYDGTSLGCIRIMFVDFEIKVVAKKGKAKIEIYNMSYSHVNQVTLRKQSLNTISDRGPCSSSNRIEELLNCDNCKDGLSKFYYYLNSYFNTLMANFSNIDFKVNTSSEKW